MSAVAAAAKRIVERVPKAARTFKTSTGQQSGGHGHSSGVRPFSISPLDEGRRLEMFGRAVELCCGRRATMTISMLSICTVCRRYKLWQLPYLPYSSQTILDVLVSAADAA